MNGLATAPPEPLAVGAADAARMIGVSPRTYWRLLAQKRIPPGFKLCGRRVWRVRDLQTFVENGFQVQT